MRGFRNTSAGLVCDAVQSPVAGCIAAPSTPQPLQTMACLDGISPMKRRKVTCSVPGVLGMVSPKPQSPISSSSMTEAPNKGFATAAPIRHIFEKMELNVTGVLMVLAWQDSPHEVQWGSKASKSIAFHCWGVASEHQWVRLSAYGGMCERLCAFLGTLEGGFGFVEFSNVLHNRPLRAHFDGALAVKFGEGCKIASQPCQENGCDNAADIHCSNCWDWFCDHHLGLCLTCERGWFCPICQVPINHTCRPTRPVPED